MNTGREQVVGVANHDGIAINHPRLLEGIDNLIKKGYGNEQIVKVTGAEPFQIDKRRGFLKNLKNQ